ncbi:MAG TPA: ester cyclase [Caldilineaceae bacterium]|nr:ester cyclase [Caldilineaceae bacterium]
MSTQENKQLARRAFEEVWNQGKLEAIDEIYAPNQVSYGLGMEVPPGAQGLKQFVSIYRAAYPDTHFTVEDVIAEGDKVAVRWTATGTHRGELMGIAPTGKRVTVTGIAISRIENGKIAESWNNFDALGQLQQLGVIPAPGQSA